MHFCIYRCRSPPAARSVTAFQRSDRRCDAWIARKNFFKNHLPLLEVQPPLTVVVAKGEEMYQPPLRTRREVNTCGLIRTKSTSSSPLMRFAKRYCGTKHGTTRTNLRGKETGRFPFLICLLKSWRSFLSETSTL